MTANQQLGVRWFDEIWNQQHREVAAELLSPDSVLHEGGVDTVGVDAFYAYYDRMHASFSDIHVTVHEALEHGDKVCVRWSCRMTHTGSAWAFLPPEKLWRPPASASCA